MYKKKWSLVPRWFLPATLLMSVLLAMVPICLTAHSALAATPPAVLWAKTFGGPAGDGFNSVQQTADGGYIAAGYTNFTTYWDRDAMLVKTDALGNQQWVMTLGNPADDEVFNSVQQAPDGGYVVAGNTAEGACLIRTDPLGNLEWQRLFGSSGNAFNSLQKTVDGGYVAAGQIGGDGWLVKTDASGTQQWGQTLVGPGDSVAQSVKQTADGGYIIAGYTYPPLSVQNVWLVKTDASGTQEWDQAFVKDYASCGYSAGQTADGGYIVAGYARQQTAAWLIKTDASGIKQWDYTSGGGSDYMIGYSAQQTADGGYVMAGRMQSHAGMGGFAWLVKTDASGTYQWGQNFIVPGNSGAYSMQQTADGGYVVAGWAWSGAGGGGLEYNDARLIKLAGEGPVAPVPEVAPLVLLGTGLLLLAGWVILRKRGAAATR